MTTFEPGASDVFTHGLDCRPRSTALRASRPAAIITDGFDVLVHDVIAAITTWPWSSSVSRPSSIVSGTACETRSATCTRVPSSAAREVSWPEPLPLWPGGSDAGKDSSTSSSTSVPRLSAGSGSGSGRMSSSAPRKADLASVSETRSCGRFGPASDGTTSPRSSSSVSEYVFSSVSASCHRPCVRA